MRCNAQATTRKTRILDVVYNASNNELVSRRCCPFACCNRGRNACGPCACRACADSCCVGALRQVRTQTLVKSAIIQVDATPFKQYYQQHYGVEVRALVFFYAPRNVVHALLTGLAVWHKQSFTLHALQAAALRCAHCTRLVLGC